MEFVMTQGVGKGLPPWAHWPSLHMSSIRIQRNHSCTDSNTTFPNSRQSTLPSPQENQKNLLIFDLTGRSLQFKIFFYFVCVRKSIIAETQCNTWTLTNSTPKCLQLSISYEWCMFTNMCVCVHMCIHQEKEIYKVTELFGPNFLPKMKT